MDEKCSHHLPIRSDDIGFKPDEMLSCDSCGKPNGPNRTSCLYCGGPVAGSTPKLEIREVEDWENGFNVILTDCSGGTHIEAAGKLAADLGIDATSLRSILLAGKPIPMARVESADVASEVARKLSQLGVETRILADELLAVTTSQTRLREISFRDDELGAKLFNRDESVVLDRSDIALLVTGVIHESRTEAMEKRKRGSRTTLSESETSSDQAFIDIYSRRDPVGWRIPSSGFDFSCLGDEKTLLAGDNLGRLLDKLSTFAPGAKVVDDYLEIHSLLEHAWQIENRREVFGFQRSGFARKDLASLKTKSNLTQVNKYSRLQWHLL